MSEQLSRRTLLKGGGLIAASLATPAWLSSLALASDSRSHPKNRVLVVCQLSGGNDGLNTVVPYTDPSYYLLRPNIAVPESEVLALDDKLGLHPSLQGLRQLYDRGHAAVVQNVGCPNQSQSHFQSMDAWHTASPDQRLKYGWLGRYLDTLHAAGAMCSTKAVSLGAELPLALLAKEAEALSIGGSHGLDGFAACDAGNGPEPLVHAAARLRNAVQNRSSRFRYESDAFGSAFAQAASVVAVSPETQIIYFQVGGFDTHARQAESHGRLLTSLDKALSTFQSELSEEGHADRVATLVFSEFGRSAAENSTLGTDHGSTAPVFLVGNGVKGGVHGNPETVTDFREIYASVLETWLGTDSSLLLGGSFRPVGVFQEESFSNSVCAV